MQESQEEIFEEDGIIGVEKHVNTEDGIGDNIKLFYMSGFDALRRTDIFTEDKTKKYTRTYPGGILTLIMILCIVFYCIFSYQQWYYTQQTFRETYISEGMIFNTTFQCKATGGCYLEPHFAVDTDCFQLLENSTVLSNLELLSGNISYGDNITLPMCYCDHVKCGWEVNVFVRKHTDEYGYAIMLYNGIVDDSMITHYLPPISSKSTHEVWLDYEQHFNMIDMVFEDYWSSRGGLSQAYSSSYCNNMDIDRDYICGGYLLRMEPRYVYFQTQRTQNMFVLIITSFSSGIVFYVVLKIIFTALRSCKCINSKNIINYRFLKRNKKRDGAI